MVSYLQYLTIPVVWVRIPSVNHGELKHVSTLSRHTEDAKNGIYIASYSQWPRAGKTYSDIVLTEQRC